MGFVALFCREGRDTLQRGVSRVRWRHTLQTARGNEENWGRRRPPPLTCFAIMAYDLLDSIVIIPACAGSTE